MQPDLLSIALGVIVVLIFMAMFTLLRTMNSPFIVRFESILHGKIEKLQQYANCYCIKFIVDGREFELLEVKHKTNQGQGTVYNDFIFLRTRSQKIFSLRFCDVFNEKKIKFVLDEVFESGTGKEFFQIPPLNFDEFFKEFKILTDNSDVGREFLRNQEAVAVLKNFKMSLGVYGVVLPVRIQDGIITMDYSLLDRHLNELVTNPRSIKNHIALLGKLAEEVDRL